MPRVSRLLVIGIICICTVLSASAVQASERGLDQIRGLALVVEKIDEDGTRCGISEDLLDAAMRLPLSSSGPKVQGSALPFLTVSATTVIASGGSCVVSIYVGFSRPFSPYNDNPMRFVYGTTWNSSYLLVGSQSTMGKRVSDTLEAATKQFIAAWLKEQ